MLRCKIEGERLNQRLGWSRDFVSCVSDFRLEPSAITLISIIESC
jgi:hypothetical protein